MTPEEVVSSLFRAVESHDLEAIGGCFSADATYRNVPYDPAVGREAIVEMFRLIVTKSERIEWQVISSAFSETRAHVERLDCFWINGVRYAVPCHCVAEVNTQTAEITDFRDYVDIGRWRDTLGDALSA